MRPFAARIRTLFEQFVDLTETEQGRLLRGGGIANDERVALKALLDADRSSDAAIDIPASDWIDQLESEAFEAATIIGQRVGPYRIVEMVGRGGSSLVFRATRSIGDVEHTVALKLLNLRWLPPELLRRFRREQQILAQLSHPNIARLLDSGVGEDGIPYLVIEFVEGLNLLEFAKTHSLSRDARLRLLEDFCRAVDAAHRLLIVHRDLKPSNVLVAADGQIKVLDFGTAKLLGSDDPVTLTHWIQLTPEYAAPEQYRTGPTTTATDVYALGVIAAELLIGVRLGPNAAWLDGATVEGDIRARRRHLDADLSGMLEVALASDPAMRYPSAGQLADDIRRFLRNEPLEVRASSHAYRLRRFIARHRASVLMVAAFVAVGLARLCVAMWQGIEARDAAVLSAGQAEPARNEANRAIHEQERAAAAARFLVGPFQGSDSRVDRRERLTASRILDRGSADLGGDVEAGPE
jgi:serine/threonine-protein kinase